MDKSLNPPEARPGVPGAAGPLRVVGCGNPFASDDAAGLEVVRRLRAAGGLEWELLELPQAGVEVMEVLEGAETVIFIDAVASGSPPGTIHLVLLPSPAIEPRALGSISSHGWGLTETLRLRAALGRPSPRLLLVGIEIERAAPGGVLSPAVEAAIQIVVERFSALCAMLRGEENTSRNGCWRFPPGEGSFPGGSRDVFVAAGGG